MKRRIRAAVLAGLVLGGVGTGAGATIIEDIPGPPGEIVDNVLTVIENIRTPPKRVLIGGYYRRIGTSNQFAILCEATAYGGTAVFTRIKSCTITSSNGGVAKGVTPVTVPGWEAITVGYGGFNTGTYTACLSAEARFLDGTIISVSGCEPAHFLHQGYI